MNSTCMVPNFSAYDYNPAIASTRSLFINCHGRVLNFSTLPYKEICDLQQKRNNRLPTCHRHPPSRHLYPAALVVHHSYVPNHSPMVWIRENPRRTRLGRTSIRITDDIWDSRHQYELS